MGLPWVRLDANIANHDKVLALLSDPSPAKWRAFTVYVCALGWSGGAGTDGLIPDYALKSVHGDNKTARLLEKYRLFERGTAGWNIPNYAIRQQLSAVSEAKADALRRASAKANCVRWHGDSCWQKGRCTRGEPDA